MAEEIQFEPIQFEEAPTQGAIQFEPIQFEEAPTDKPKPGFYTSTLTEKEIDSLAQKHGVDSDWLKSEVGFYGGSIEGKEGDTASVVLGALGRGPLMNAPQFLARRSVGDKESKALEEMVGLIEQRRPGSGEVIDLVTGVLTPGLGLLKGAKATATTAAKLGTMALGSGALGAVSGTFASRPGEELEQAAIGAGVGAGLGIALAGAPVVAGKAFGKVFGPKVRDKAAAEVQKDIGSGVERIMKETELYNKHEKDALLNYVQGKELTDIQKQALEVNARRLSPTTKLEGDELIQTRLEALTKNTLKNISGKVEKKKAKQVAELARVIKDEGEDFVANSYNRARQVEAAIESVGKLREDTSGFGFGALKYMDNKYVAKYIDSKLGTNVDGLIDDMSQSHLAGEALKDVYNRKLKEISEKTKQLGVKPEEVFDYINSKGTTALKPEAAPVVAEYQQLFKDLRQEAIDLGLPIRELGEGKWYVPNKLMRTEDMLSAMRSKANDISSQLQFNPLSHITDEEFQLLKNHPDGKDFIKALEIGSGMEIKAAGQYNKFAPQVMNPSGEFLNEVSVAGATRAREGDIPAFIMERNIDSAAQSWMNSTFQRALFRDQEGELRKLRDMFQRTGEEKFYKWADTLLKDISGARRPGTLATATKVAGDKFRLWARDKMDKATTPVAKELWKTARDIPDIYNTLNANLYTNVLGTKPRALVSNLIQPLALSAPEIGGKYGFKVAAKAMEDIGDLMDNGRKAIVRNPVVAKELGIKVGDVAEFKNITKYLQAQNLLAPADKILNSPEFIAGLDKGYVATAADKATNITQKMGLLYGVAEMANRQWISAMGRVLTKELQEGVPEAQKFLARLDEGQKRAVTKKLGEIKALREVGQENAILRAELELNEIFMKHMLSKTAFNYDKYSASQFARSAGPMLSMFTKWPTSVLGDFIYTAKDPRFDVMQKAGQYWGKYGAPYMLMAAIHQGAKSTGADETPAYRSVMGKQGLAGSMPVMSGLSALGGDIRAVPPVAEAVVKSLKGIDVENPEQSAKKVWDAMKVFVPGQGAYRLMADDILPILIGE